MCYAANTSETLATKILLLSRDVIKKENRSERYCVWTGCQGFKIRETCSNVSLPLTNELVRLMAESTKCPCVWGVEELQNCLEHFLANLIVNIFSAA